MNQQARKRLRFLRCQSPPPLLCVIESSLCSQAQFTPTFPGGPSLNMHQEWSSASLRHPNPILQRSAALTAACWHCPLSSPAESGRLAAIPSPSSPADRGRRAPGHGAEGLLKNSAWDRPLPRAHHLHYLRTRCCYPSPMNSVRTLKK